MTYDVIVIGAGPAGLAAACAAREELGREVKGIGEGEEGGKRSGRVLILERDTEPGGILQQCIHNGFGLHRFKEELTGPEYAARWVDKAKELGVETRCQTMVMKITPASRRSSASPCHQLFTKSPVYGEVTYEAKSIVMAMGCRERPRGAIMTPGTRPAGVYTAGTVQRLVNMEGIVPGRRCVILGSGDIGLIMARRLTFQGVKVLACVEIMPKSSGLMRNVVQCLNDFEIPLLLSHTVTEVEGKDHVTEVRVSKVDDNRKPIAGSEQHFDCDMLVLSCGLIPETELARQAGIEITDTIHTNQPGVFAGGNVVKVYDLVDWVSRDAELAGKEAAQYALSLH